MRFSTRGTKEEDEKTGHRPHLRRLAATTVAIVGVLAVSELPAAASAATQAPYAHSAGTNAALASARCAASRPHSGTVLYAGITGGLGRLTIHNGRSQDGVVMLVRGHSRAIGVYVRAHASTMVHDIKSGTYTVDFTTGSLFHACAGRFTRGAAYRRFNKRLLFVSPPYYNKWELTLQSVPNGNASITPINPVGFPAP